MKRCCLNCGGFVWWDGDYCCVRHMDIHQYGYKNGIWMNEDIIRTMETPETCEDYDYNALHAELYEPEFKKLIDYIKLKDEYNKFTL